MRKTEEFSEASGFALFLTTLHLYPPLSTSLNQETGRTSSFEGKFAERTPSGWDKAFKAEMEQALSGGGYHDGAWAGAGERAAEVESGNPPALASLIVDGGADNAPPGKGPGAGEGETGAQGGPA